MSLIQVKNVVKRFKDKNVVDNISFDVVEGEVFGLIGPNGAGKSTLINIMTGLWESSSGDVEIGGYSIKKQPLKVKEQIGLVPQEVALVESVTAYDNLEFFGSLYGLKGSVLKERINEALELTGLEGKRKEKIKKFSGGMKRRLNIAAAIMHRPRILIMDEPTVGIDPQSRNHIFEFTKKLNKENKTTVIYTSHYMEEVELLCSKVFIIDLGKEVAYGSKQSIKTMLGDESTVRLQLDNYKGELLLKLKGLDGVRECTGEEDCVKLLVEGKNFKLNQLIRLIEDNSVRLRGINLEEPSLEEVFLSITGKKLRD